MSDTALFFDIVNVALTLALIAIVQFRFQLRWWIVALLLFHFALIFLTNSVLFDPSFMPDQFKYLRIAQSIRGAVEPLRPDEFRLAVDSAGVFFGLFPLPVINSIYSIAIINYLLYLIAFLFLYQNGMLKGLSLWVFLLYPSLLFYTSLSLRDTLIFVLMTFGIWLYYRDRILLSIVVQLPLAVLKLQNLGIFAVSLLLFMILAVPFPRASRHRLHPLIALVLIVAVVGAASAIYRPGLRGLNLYRHLFWTEEMGLPKWTPVNPATQIGSVGQLIRETFISIPYFLVKPLPWEASGAFQLLQSAENILVLGAIAILLWRAFRNRVHTPVMNFLVVYLVVSLAVYGLTVWNFGTAARYRFPFVSLFLVFFARLYDIEGERQRLSSPPANAISRRAAVQP